MSGATAAALADEAVRARIRDDLDTTLVVEAAAGTGKTSALVSRMVAALAAGRARLERVVAVTFTEAAAGELKLRLRTAIERARQDDALGADAGERLGAALSQLEAARIATIHAFCAELLRERPVEARVDPRFQVAPEESARALFDRVFDRWFEAQLAAPGPGVRRVLRRRARRNETGTRERLRAAAWQLAAWRDFPAPWRHEPFERDAALAGVLGQLRALVASPDDGPRDDWFARSIAEIARVLRDLDRRAALAGHDPDGIEAELTVLARARHWGWRGWAPRAHEPGRRALRERRAQAKAALDAFVRASGADLAPQLREDCWPVLEEYRRLKARAGVLDFLDLLLHARDLVRDDAAVRAELQERCLHLFVDELQDTDPLQLELLLLLAADDPRERDWRRVRPVPGKLFLVGDPKQSIYRFRRADVALYEALKRQLVAAGAAVVHLTVSFRAVPAIQEAVNAAFSLAMAGDGQAQHVALQPHRPEHPEQPAVVVLPVPRPYDDRGRTTDRAIEESLPRAVAAFVHWLVTASGWTVSERERPGQRVAVQPRHVCLLFRRMRSWNEDVTRPYVRALEARTLRHVLLGGSSFHAREEVGALRVALAAVERPGDELALFATLRGPLVALGDGALLAWRQRFGSLHPFRALPDDLPPQLAEVAAALAVLRDLHRDRNRRPVAETVVRLLGALRAHAGLAIWPTGEQALANVGRLVDMARRAERQGLTSFRAFVDRLEADAEDGEAGEAPIVEDGTEGVRIMTVHRAKGLEFPVVVLVDPTANATPNEPARHVDPGRGLCALTLAGAAPPDLLDHADVERLREQEEAVRLLYVAATRARDLLVVPALADAPYDGWLAPLAPAVYPPAGEGQAPETRRPAGCPPLLGDGVVERPAGAQRPAGSVTPGQHRPARGAHRVVWWAPNTLALDVEESVGLTQQRLLAVDEGGVRSDAGIRAHAAWQAERVRVRAAASVPALRVATASERAVADAARGGVASEAAGPGSAAEPEVAVERVEVPAGRPHGARFGALVHAVLAAVELGADADAVRAVALLEGRVLGAPAGEVEAAAHAVVRALAHPVLRRAARARECRRECPLVVRLEDGTLVEGVVDAAFLDDGGWTVVDFKTDAEAGEREAQDRRQVALYCAAVARASGLPVRGILLRL